LEFDFVDAILSFWGDQVNTSGARAWSMAGLRMLKPVDWLEMNGSTLCINPRPESIETQRGRGTIKDLNN
jgi:hypothetical protein